MRLLVLASLLAVPVAAQTVLAPPAIPPPDSTRAAEADPLPVLTTADLLGETDAAPPDLSPTPYSTLGIAGGWDGNVGVTGRIDGGAGVAFPSGFRLGAFAAVHTSGTRSTILSVGPEASYQTDLGRGFALNARGYAGLSVGAGETGLGESYGARRLGAGASVRVEREIPIAGSFRLAPSLGAYATAQRRSAVSQFDYDARTGGSAGVLVGADVRFRLLGRDLSLPLTVAIPVAGGVPTDVTGVPMSGGRFKIEF